VKNRTTGRLAWSLAGLSMGFVAASVVFMFVNHGQSTFDFNGPFFAAAIVAFAVLGSLLASRRPSNPMGWIFLAAGALFALNILADQYAHYGLVQNPGSAPGAGIGA
jgi:cytochrome bd-type quinol oxidase subunit 2